MPLLYLESTVTKRIPFLFFWCDFSGEWALKQTHIIGPNIMGLKGATVGIVGLGNIGLETAKLLKAFKVSKILYTSRRVKEEGKQMEYE